ncbi:ankyrin repeat domain-containing protein [Wolbachia endosymbiont of Pentalonia nigronervosa]|jgi:ankyrin repeat protein|uniref:ankyrin repeat domain-containing protein n=1 Tax=Wolbachia endosymbiont of Pentalonia nigronervosa TaxID=1301914 RepID=UPI00165F21B6|nr:ankyrin repeat domain-containing protein [Wolbachia endosymbiont of Pentalonia nigronervosa]MBD0391720.1 ankyrin repeat domain-containing protein [Wolbachia endosymbiont of Pentalonia nigronervosa]
MHDREWQWVLNTIKSDKNIIDKIKEKLAKKHRDVYIKWEKKKFDINYLFSFRDGYINNACTLLHICVRYGLEKIINALLAIEGININAVDNRYGETPLHIAVEIGYENIVKILLKNGADVNAVDKNSVTPLHLAARGGYVEVVENLLLEGANINAVDSEYGATPLHIAAESGYINILGILLKKGADINAIDKKAETPLHVAARNNHIEVVKVLLENKADVDAININKATPLHWAAKNGYIKLVEALLKNNANAFLKDKNNKIPRDLTSDDNIKQLLSESKERKDCISALVLCTTFFLMTPFVLTIWRSELTFMLKFIYSIVMVAVIIIIKLVIDIKRTEFQPSTQVNGMHVVGVHYNSRSSEISVV